MKTILILTLISAAVLIAAPPTQNDICVAIPDADLARVEEAFGSILGLTDALGRPRPATNEEITNATAQWMGQTVHDYERRVNMSSFTPPPFHTGSKLNGPTPVAPPKPTATPKPKK